MNKRAVGLVCSAVMAWAGLAAREANAQLPADFPAITINTYHSNKVAPGYLFVGTWNLTPGAGSYLMILNNDGTPVDGDKYTKLADVAGDFKVQPNGLLSYAQAIGNLSYTGGWDVKHQIADESLTHTRETVQMDNGYLSEFHDFQLLPNGNVLTFGYYLSEVDMSRIVDGGYPAALVSGGVIQELDAQRHAIWQWRSWDHYSFAGEVTSRNPVFSAFHFNDLFMDRDGNVVVGTPEEIRKINRQTGEVMWTLGGPHNEFTIVGDGVDASDFGGHGTYRLPNGNLLTYDNSHGNVTSKALEYSLDEVNKVLTLVWSYTPDTKIAGMFTGNAQRLPNGNTLICWGIPRGTNVPICTEVTAAGEKVFELTFDDTSIQSYRAFRFPFPSDSQKIESANTELAAGNSYDFTNTGVGLVVTSGAGGYNEVTVTREPYAPLQVSFVAAKAPSVLPVRVKMEQTGIASMTSEVSFDAQSFGFDEPAALTVYHRATTGSGIFVALPTSYNPVTKQLRATVSGFGEFAFGHPDVAEVAYPPILNRPETYRGVQTNMVVAPRKVESNTVYAVNQELPVLLSWSPRGFGHFFNLQVATDPAFTSPVIDLSYRMEAYYVWSNALPGTTYHWRVQSLVESNGVFVAGDWSTNTLQTIAPFVQVVAPNGAEAWKRGIKYFVQWNDDLAEDVVVDLYKGGAFQESLATNASTGVYQWEVGLDLVPGNDYAIKVSSATNAALSSMSAPFSIDPPAIDPAEFTRFSDGRVQFSLSAPAAAEVTVLASTNLLDWYEVQTVPVTNDSAVFIDKTAAASAHRFYRLRTP